MQKNNEYIFKKNQGSIEYVGDFDGMYKNIKDPWGQINDPYYGRRGQIIIDTLRELKPLNVLDVGCGLGAVTQLISLLITKDVLGVDISVEAIKRAKKMYSTLEFEQLNIITDDITNSYDTIVMSGVLWYILSDLDSTLEKLRNHLNYLGYLVIFQTFISDQQWGKDKIDGYKGFLKYLCGLNNYRIVKSLYCNAKDGKQDSITVLQRWGKHE